MTDGNERLHILTERESAIISLRNYSERAEGMIKTLGPNHWPELTTPIYKEYADLVGKEVQNHVEFLEKPGLLDILLSVSDKTVQEAAQEEREQVVQIGRSVVGAFSTYKLVAEHYFDYEVKSERKKRPTHVVAEEIDYICKRSTEVKDGAFEFFTKEHFLLDGVLEFAVVMQ